VLHARVELRLGPLDLDVDLEVADGEVVGLVGPNGAGKTTLLRAIAGLQPLDRGRVEVGGRVVDAPDDGIFVPPAERPIGVVFQDHLLFPRMSARDNVAFALRARGVDRRTARARADEWLSRFGLGDHAAHRPAALSGGQAQRVALARALATSPSVLLLDEPLAALDAQVRVEVRAELRHHLESFSGARLLVTHDPVDAMILADRLVVLEHGHAVQSGSATDIARQPRSQYVAEFIGVNRLDGVAVAAHTVRLDTGAEITLADPVTLGPVAVMIRPQAVALYRDRPEGSPRNAWPVTVAGVEVEPDRARVQLAGAVPLVAEVTPASVTELALTNGAELWATVKAVEIAAYPR
jgi:molybdate transport system ATP-binding protein